MNRLILPLAIGALIAACSAKPVVKADAELAALVSAEKILSVDGAEPDSLYRADLTPGPHETIIEYRTYTAIYRCTFDLTVSAGQTYEVVEHNNQYPLRIYRQIRRNWLWFERRDPIEPRSCAEVTEDF